jgi:hypothetical protein
MRAPATSPSIARYSILVATNLLQVASLLKIGDTWRGTGPKEREQSVSGTFPDEAKAAVWARKIEAEMDAERLQWRARLAHLTLKEGIEWCVEEIGARR